MGWKVTVIPESVVYHVGGGTLPASSPFKLFLNYRNNLLMLDNNLAKTYALEEYRKGASIEFAATKGWRRAQIRITLRKCLDWISAIVYVLTFQFKCVKSVFRAHKEYRTLTYKIDRNAVKQYIQNSSEKAGVKGMYRKWIVLHSMLKGENIFEFIIEDDFYKI